MLQNKENFFLFFNTIVCTLLLYLSLLKGVPNRMFSLSVPENIHACCDTSAILPLALTSPPMFFISPMMAETREDLPDPTGPATPSSSPSRTSRSRSNRQATKSESFGFKRLAFSDFFPSSVFFLIGLPGNKARKIVGRLS